MKASVRIGGGGGFWGDSPDGARQIIADGAVDYLVLDYLAEITMSILARLKQKSPDAGYAPAARPTIIMVTLDRYPSA